MDWVFGEIAIMKGREDMFKLLQNEYEEYREYFKELELIQRQYNQEEAYYFIINKLIRDSIDDKDISVRDVHKLIKAMGFPGRNRYLRGYAGQVPDFVILDKMFDERQNKDQSGRVYGCVEIKAFTSARRQGKDNRKLYSNYIRPIENWLENKEVVEGVEVVHEKLCQNRIKIEFESLEKKEEFIKKYFTDYTSIPIDVMGEIFLCNKNGNLCKNESKELIKQKLLKIQKRNDKESLVLRDGKKAGRKYCVGLRNGKSMDLVYQLLEELIGFKKVIFTNGYEWILMQHQCDNKDFQCESLANFYPEPKQEKTFEKLKREQGQDMSDMSEKLDAEKQKLKIPLTEFQKDEDFKAWTAMTFAELRQHNFKQWLHLKFEINRIFKEAKSQNKQGEEKIGNDE